MVLTKENSLQLYHYCTCIADAIRPFLNSNPLPEADPIYWIPKLTEFEAIIDSILSQPGISNEIDEIRKVENE
jgi:hypothetical protein